MPQYTARRLLSSLPVLLGILVVVFLLARLIPGEPCKAILGEKATAETCERFNKANGLDKPIYVQFGIYLSNVLQGDFGDSMAMAPGLALSQFARVTVTARVSKSANAKPQPGDLQGLTTPVKVGAERVSIVIDTELR